MLIPKAFTEQEEIVAVCLSELGFRYERQVEIGKYTVDFLIPDENLILEADGPYGHLKKRDKKRDEDLRGLSGYNIIHILGHEKELVKLEIMEKMCLV